MCSFIISSRGEAAKFARQDRGKVGCKEEMSYFPDSLNSTVTSVSPLKQVQWVWNNVFPNCIKHQSWEDTDDNKRQKAMWKSGFISYSALSNLSNGLSGVLACLAVDVTCHSGARLLGTVSNYTIGRLDKQHWLPITRNWQISEQFRW